MEKIRLNTILRSTNSGRTGFYEIGKVIEAGGWEYTIRSAFQPTFPNGAKPTLLVCTHEFAKKPTQKTKLSFVVLHKYSNQQYWGYGSIEGSSAYCEQVCKGNYGYELKTSYGKYQIVHEFTLNNKRCFVGVFKGYNCGGLVTLWKNEENGKYYKVMSVK
jgi:hypothetical protein